MTNQSYRLSKAIKDAFIVKESTTTSIGNVNKLTLVDTSLTQTEGYWIGASVVILYGSSIGQVRDITAFTAATDTITVSGAFNSQIASGTKYKIISFRPSDAEVAALQTDVTIIKADTQVIEDSTLKAAPTAGSLSRFIASGGTALGTQLPASKSLYDVIALDRWDVRLSAARAAYIDNLNNTQLLNIPNISTLTTTRIGYLDYLNSGEYTGTVSAGTAAETTLKEIVTTARIEIKSIWLDLNNLTANATIKLYHIVDATNYRVFETLTWLFATDDKGVLITGFSINNNWKITITGTEGAGVNIPYNIIYQTME